MSASSSGRSSHDWREALLTLETSLERSTGAQLVQMKIALSATLEKVTEQMQKRGVDSCLEYMVSEASCIGQVKHDPIEVHRFLACMHTNLEINVEDADPSNQTIKVCATGTWGFWGNSYGFNASVIEKKGRSKGVIQVDGLNFCAHGNLVKGSFGSSAEVANWIRMSGVQMSNSDVLNVVVVALEVLAKRKAVGIADVDILKIVFDLMRSEAGLPPSKMSEKDSDAYPCGTTVENTLNHDGEDVGLDATNCDSIGAELDNVLKEVRSSGNDGQGSDFEEEQEDTENEELESANDDDENSKSEDEDDKFSSKASVQAPLQETQETQDELQKDNHPSDEDDFEETMFASKSGLESIKAKLAKGQTPTNEDLTRLIDSNSWPSDGEIIPIDQTVFGVHDLSLESLPGLIKQLGAQQVAKLFVEAEIAGEGDDEDLESEEDDEEEEENLDEVDNSVEEVVADQAAEAPPRKRLRTKCAPR